MFISRHGCCGAPFYQPFFPPLEKYLLIIDPETQELRKLREILTREGYNIMTATDKDTAHQICESVPVHLVLGRASILGFNNVK